MKKILLILILLFPLCVNAKTVSQTLVEACDTESITIDSSYYQESKEKAHIIVFRRSGCIHCYHLLTYLANMLPLYGQYYDVKVYEVSNEDNNKLVDKYADKFNRVVNGVPYYIIGDKDFLGYSTSDNDDILNAIKDNSSGMEIVTMDNPKINNIYINDELLPNFNNDIHIYNYKVKNNENINVVVDSADIVNIDNPSTINDGSKILIKVSNAYNTENYTINLILDETSSELINKSNHKSQYFIWGIGIGVMIIVLIIMFTKSLKK